MQQLVSDFWRETFGEGVAYSPRLLDRVWTANRCLQLNSQQVASMPLRFFGNREPAWVANPDPVWYPNGIGDAVFAAASHINGWGDAFLYVTSRYADGFPAGWTPLHPSTVNVSFRNGRRVFKVGEEEHNPADVVQISRDPRGGLRGTSTLRAFAPQLWGSLAAAEAAQKLNEIGVQTPVLRSNKKLQSGQAKKIQDQWVAARIASRGAPAVMDPELEYQSTLSFSPKDLLLIDAQEFDARVIAAAFSVPAILLNLALEGSHVYQTPIGMFEAWWRSELRPMALRISRALTARMLPRGSWVEFDAREAVAPDFKDLAATWTALVEKGIASPDEARASVLRLPPQSAEASLEDLLTPPVAATSASSMNGSRPVMQEVF